MSKNFISYTNLDYDSIKTSLQGRLAQDSRFANFSESSFYAILSEIFAATTDFTNYYIERRAEESFLDTAKLRSSVSLLSKMLGYTIRRPIPSSTQIKITIKSLPQLSSVGDSLIIPQFTSFVMGKLNFVNTVSLSYKITQADIDSFGGIPGYFKELNYYSNASNDYGSLYADNDFSDTNLMTPITLIQGEKAQYTIYHNTNDLTNTRYQKYTINDKKFSNIYGSEDIGFDKVTGTNNIDNNLTKVTIGGSKEFDIDRKTLMTNKALAQNDSYGAGQNIYQCVIKTNLDDSVEISFGDDIVSSIGAGPNEDIVVDYFSTEGASANQTGVVGKVIDIQLSPLNDFTKSNIDIRLNKNITGGVDIEELDSIKLNAPAGYSTMERCVTAKDYITYLKTLFYNGDVIQNAIAWGEQEEAKENGVTNIKLFNVVLFTFLIDMYKKSNGLYVGLKTNNDIGVDDEGLNDYFTIVVKSDSSTPLKSQNISALNPSLQTIYDNLYTRSEISVKNLYISPLLRDYDLVGSVYLNPLVDNKLVMTKINDAIYTYISNNIDFKVPTYISNIIDVVESFPEVKHADLSFASSSNILNKLVTTVSADCLDIESDIPSGVPVGPVQWFNQQSIGYVFHSSIKDKASSTVREYSTNLLKTPFDIYMSSLLDVVTETYDNDTWTAICKTMPQNLFVKLMKVDSTSAQYSLVWNDNYFGTNDFYATERNISLGLMKVVFETINNYLKSDSKNIEQIDLIVKECGCDIRDNFDFSDVDFSKSDKVALQSFLDNDLIKVVRAFRDSFAVDVNKTTLDSFGNISNFSMRNEVARIDTSKLSFIYQK